MKVLKGELRNVQVMMYPKGFHSWDDGTCPYHDDKVWVIFGCRSGTRFGTLMHTSPVVSITELPRHNGDERKWEAETENSIYHLFGEIEYTDYKHEHQTRG